MKKMVYYFFKYKLCYGWSYKDVFCFCYFKKENLDKKVMVKYMVLVFISFKNGCVCGKEWLNEVKKLILVEIYWKFDELKNLVEEYSKV